jgi:hypothetical protein
MSIEQAFGVPSVVGRQLDRLDELLVGRGAGEDEAGAASVQPVRAGVTGARPDHYFRLFQPATRSRRADECKTVQTGR